MTLHRCTETGCPSFGQRTFRDACACHRTDEQVLREQRDELLEALGAAEPHVETLNSLLLPQGRESEAVKASWRVLRQVRSAITKARGEA